MTINRSQVDSPQKVQVIQNFDICFVVKLKVEKTSAVVDDLRYKHAYMMSARPGTFFTSFTKMFNLVQNMGT